MIKKIKTLIFLCMITFSFSSKANEKKLEELRKTFSQGETTIDRVIALTEYNDILHTNIKSLTSNVLNKLTKKEKKNFQASAKSWQEYFSHEKKFINTEFRKKIKYGSQSSEIVGHQTRLLLESRIKLLKKSLTHL